MAQENEEHPAEKEEDRSPGEAFLPFVKMDLLYNKLKMLNYDKEFLAVFPTFKSIDRLLFVMVEVIVKVNVNRLRRYFVDEINSGEQFFMFVNLASWLIRKCGRVHFKTPLEGVPSQFTSSKLKAGAGDQCIAVLTALADQALQKTNFSFQAPEFPVDEPGGDSTVIQEADIESDQPQEDEFDISDDEEDEQDEGFIDLEITKHHDQLRKPKQMIEISDMKWQQEIDRVTPSLKIVIKQRAAILLQNWRTHLHAINQFKTELSSVRESLEESLGKLSKDIARTLDTIGSREKYLNAQLEPLLSKLRSTQDQLAEVKEKYREASGGIMERVKTLSQVSEELEQVKQEMKESSSRLTDGTPLTKIKQAISALKEEITLMRVQSAMNDQINVAEKQPFDINPTLYSA
ncbi:unnamed protein product [Soboliphyme baturini]|uniref:Intraflagellar transport protein 57 homolog n=1 Tax=Soboliphyme baturini TaxID=241478 RepID=A0A183IDN6_9BILA|nr:unnamed protein product [Soboliphyme baturini]